MSGEEEEPQMKEETVETVLVDNSEPEKSKEEPSKEANIEVNKDTNTEPPSVNNENFVVLDTIVNEEDNLVEPEVLKEEKIEELKEEITLKDETEPLKDEPEGDSPVKTSNDNATSEDAEIMDSSKDAKTSQPAEINSSKNSGTKPVANAASANNNRVRKKPKAPVVDVNSLRKRKWQLKVYPLHAEDLQLSYVSILCKLASESLLYIPSEGRAGKAELYVATQKETAAIIGKLLRMEFYNQLLSIEVVRKDTGGKEEGDESKKECKAYLMFDKHLSKKIFDAKGEKGSAIEKSVTLNKLPKAATKDFIGALFPFATEIEIFENEDPAERKAVVKCKTPVTSLLVYKSFKRLEINDVHVKLSVDESVKAIKLPSMFFATPHDRKDMGPPDSLENLNRSSLPNRRPLMTPLNRRVQLIRKRALMTGLRSKKPGLGSSRGPGPLLDEPSLARRPLLSSRLQEPRGVDLMRPLIGPGRRRLSERSDRRARDRDSMERRSRRGDREDSLVTKEMMQLQNQLSQAIKNQIAMLNTAQTGPMVGQRGPMERGIDHFPPPVTPHRAPLLGQGPRGGYGDSMMPSSSRGMNQHHGSDYTSTNPWSGDMSGARMDRDSRGGVSTSNDRQMERDRMVRGDRVSERSNRGPDRTSSSIRDGRDSSSSRRGMDTSNRMDRKTSGGGTSERSGRTGDRNSRSSRDRSEKRRTTDVSRSSRPTGRQPAAFGGSGSGGDSSSSRGNGKDRHGGGSASLGLNSQGGRNGGHGDTGRQVRQADFSSSRSGQRSDNSYSTNSHSQNSTSGRYGDYNNQSSGDSNSYYRRY